MIRPLLAALLVLSSAPVGGAERTVDIGSFERVRIDGAFDVRIAAGPSPRASLSGDARALDAVDLRVDGTTLTLRRRSETIADGRNASGPVVVTLVAPRLASVVMVGSGRLRVRGMRGERADLSVAGAGDIAVEGLAAEQASASVIGTGRIVLAGRARRARLLTNGPGTIDAAALVADELTVRLDGPGETRAQARYVATIATAGSGRVEVAGRPKCTVRAPAGSAVVCGAP